MNIRIFDLDKSQYDAFNNLIPEEYINNQHVHYLCAVDEASCAAGILAYEINNGIVELLFINVYDELSSENIESALLDNLVNRIRESEILYYISSVYPNNSDYRFMKKALEERDDFAITESSVIYYLGYEDIINSELLKDFSKMSGKTTPFSELDTFYKGKFYNYIANNDIAFTSKEEESELDKKLSLCYQDSEGEVLSCILFKKHEKELELSYMMVKPGNEKAMAIIVSDALKVYKEKYANIPVIINALNDQSKNLVEKIFSTNLKKEIVYSAIRL